MSTAATNTALRFMPSLDSLLRSESAVELIERYGRNAVVEQCRLICSQLRAELLTPTASADTTSLSRAALAERIMANTADALVNHYTASLRAVHNLTGIVLHSNLGRAAYPRAAIEAMTKVSSTACNVEYDLNTGQRGRRDDHVKRWICQLTGAESATTVNNNAAAVMLTLNTVAQLAHSQRSEKKTTDKRTRKKSTKQKNIIVSRGELIEIGGSFRLPKIMQCAGCKLREVGTTNRTHLADYAQAIGKHTAALMKVHTSNYEVVGFTKAVAATDLAKLAQQHQLPFIDDLGSGNLLDLSQFGLPFERTVRTALQDGANLVTFSGDKLLGGPQCGIIAGQAKLIQAIDSNPMKRAMRLDKVILAALEAVLMQYLNATTLIDEIPTLRHLARDLPTIKQNAAELAKRIAVSLAPAYTISVEPCESQIGSGALPTRTIPSMAVCIRANAHHHAANIEMLAAQFRQLPTPVIGRIHSAALWFDCRTIDAVDSIDIATINLANSSNA